MTAGDLKRLMIFCPPRHGKSEQTTIRYPVYRMERQGAARVCVGCYNQSFAERFGRKARRIARDRFALSAERNAAKEWETEAGGVFRSCGVGNPPTGEGFNLIVIDDPVKSREEADSEAYRERVWEWYTDDLFTRREPGAAVILIMTRWHESDLAGRLLDAQETGGDRWEVVSFPALAEENDPLGRAVGEALCPDRFPAEELAAIAAVQGHSFSALYQQRPAPREGDFFKVGKLGTVGAVPAGARRVRYWDLAGAAPGKGDFTCGVLLAAAPDGRFYVEHVRRGQWPAAERTGIIRQTCEADRARYGSVPTWIEQAPGLAKEPTEDLIRALAGFTVQADLAHRDKVSRAEPFAAQVNAGNVSLLQDAEGDRWNAAFLRELSSFPNGKNDDQCDSASGGFNKITIRLDAGPGAF